MEQGWGAGYDYPSSDKAEDCEKAEELKSTTQEITTTENWNQSHLGTQG